MQKAEIITPAFPINAEEMRQVTELIYSASQGDIATVECLLKEKNLNPNLGDYDHRTALHVASGDGQMEVVKMLLSFKAILNVADRWGETPLDGAARQGQKDVALLLIKNGAIYGHKNITSLHLIESVSEEDVEAVQNLLDIGFDPNVGDYDNRTPLHIAVAVGNLELVKLLISFGADVQAIDRFGGSPMTDANAKAPRFGPDEMRDYIAKHGGRVFRDIEDDNKIDVGYLLIGIQVALLILFGIFVRYGDTAAGRDPVGSAEEVGGKYSQFQDVHVMIFIG
jgi:ankyrin repeat protein